MNIVEEIYRRADRSAIALIADDQEVSYGRLMEMADAAALPIARCSAARIGLDCPNGVAHIVLALAIVRAGKCLVPIAKELAGPERERLIRETGVEAIVDATGAVRELAPATNLAFDQKRLAELNPAFIRFSSGTTGHSKGIVLSHERLLERVTAANAGLGITSEDRVIWILPMAHHFAVSIILYLLAGATTVIVTSHMAGEVLGAARAHRGTVLYGAPFHHTLLAAENSGRLWPGLRLAVSTAGALSEATASAFNSRFGVPLSQALGLIEVGLPLVNLDAQRSKPTSVGKPMPGFEVALRDDEILLRGPGMLDAYLSPWRTRGEILEGGWFRTGDLGVIDPDGHVFLRGRRHSVINVAGMKCFPEEIEAVLCTIPGVRLARVSGKANDRVGSLPVAEIVPVDPANPPAIADLVARCRAELALYKVPARFDFVKRLPMTASGKIRR